jgi:hypothetical protein
VRIARLLPLPKPSLLPELRQRSRLLRATLLAISAAIIQILRANLGFRRNGLDRHCVKEK